MSVQQWRVRVTLGWGMVLIALGAATAAAGSPPRGLWMVVAAGLYFTLAWTAIETGDGDG